MITQTTVQTINTALTRVAHTVYLANGLKPRGVVVRVGDGVALVAGLDDVRFEELLAFDSGAFGLAYDLRADALGVVLLEGAERVHAGDGVVGLDRLPDLPVGAAAPGRILDPLGDPLDEGPPLTGLERMPLFRPAPEIIERRKVDQSLWTGIMAVDAAIPIGRGQRELLIGDRNVGKTALAVDLVAAQKPGDVTCVYVMIGHPMSRVLALHDTLERAGCLSNTVIIAAYAAASPGMRYLAPYAGATVAEWFREQGGHALLIFDDLTKHADAYRELALLLDRPPGREAFPGDIFYIHASLLERAAALTDERGGGSVTAIPLAEITDGDIAAYIPTNLISITDGQIYLDTGRFERDLRPAIDISRSVSRIGSMAQPPIMRVVAKNLKIRISQFEALEKLSRVGLDIDTGTQAAIQEGLVMRALLRQPRLSPRDIASQVILLSAVSEGWLRELTPAQAVAVAEQLIQLARTNLPDLIQVMNRGDVPEGDWRAALANLVVDARARTGEHA